MSGALNIQPVKEQRELSDILDSIETETIREGEDDKKKISFLKEGDKNIRKHPRKGVMQFLKMLKKEVNQEHLNQKKKIL